MKKQAKKAPARKAPARKAPAKKAPPLAPRELDAVLRALEARMANLVDGLQALDQRTVDVATELQAALASHGSGVVFRVLEERMAQCEAQKAEIARLQQALEVAEADAKKWAGARALAEDTLTPAPGVTVISFAEHERREGEDGAGVTAPVQP